MPEHTPDLAKIAPPLKALAWFPLQTGMEWYDGTVLLVAILKGFPRGADYRYEYHEGIL